jgi:hypothetical protein
MAPRLPENLQNLQNLLNLLGVAPQVLMLAVALRPRLTAPRLPPQKDLPNLQNLLNL